MFFIRCFSRSALRLLLWLQSALMVFDTVSSLRFIVLSLTFSFLSPGLRALRRLVGPTTRPVLSFLT